jgi:pilus assembly protein FimV
MSMIASAATASAASPLGSLFNHTKRGVNSVTPAAGGSSQPASTVSLFGSLLQSVEQVVGLPAAAAAPAGISGTAAVAGSTGAAATSAAAGTSAATASSPAQQVQSFLYSLFQALKSDGLGSPGAGGAAANTTAAGSGTGAGQYAGSLSSSLQSLIQQLGSGGSPTPQVANLESAFSGLMGASSGSAAASTSNASLQGFLNNLLQKVQSAGASSIPTVGSTVNSKA